MYCSWGTAANQKTHFIHVGYVAFDTFFNNLWLRRCSRFEIDVVCVLTSRYLMCSKTNDSNLSVWISLNHLWKYLKVFLFVSRRGRSQGCSFRCCSWYPSRLLSGIAIDFLAITRRGRAGGRQQLITGYYYYYLPLPFSIFCYIFVLANCCMENWGYSYCVAGVLLSWLVLWCLSSSSSTSWSSSFRQDVTLLKLMMSPILCANVLII